MVGSKCAAIVPPTWLSPSYRDFDAATEVADSRRFLEPGPIAATRLPRGGDELSAGAGGQISRYEWAASNATGRVPSRRLSIARRLATAALSARTAGNCDVWCPRIAMLARLLLGRLRSVICSRLAPSLSAHQLGRAQKMPRNTGKSLASRPARLED